MQMSQLDTLGAAPADARRSRWRLLVQHERLPLACALAGVALWWALSCVLHPEVIVDELDHYAVIRELREGSSPLGPWCWRTGWCVSRRPRADRSAFGMARYRSPWPWWCCSVGCGDAIYPMWYCESFLIRINAGASPGGARRCPGVAAGEGLPRSDRDGHDELGHRRTKQYRRLAG